MANEEPQAKGRSSEALKRYHASLTEEQKAARREKISAGTTVGMNKWHASRTEEHREHARELMTASAICRTFNGRRTPSTMWKKGHHPVNNTTPVALARRELTKVQKASIKRIIRDLVLEEPDKWREAIQRGRDARPPFSFPYVALAASYLDLKANEPEPPTPHEDLSDLTNEELMERAIALSNRLQADVREQAELVAANTLPVIDVQVIKEPEK